MMCMEYALLQNNCSWFENVEKCLCDNAGKANEIKKILEVFTISPVSILYEVCYTSDVFFSFTINCFKKQNPVCSP